MAGYATFVQFVKIEDGQFGVFSFRRPRQPSGRFMKSMIKPLKFRRQSAAQFL
jgi:hypothetical protein